MKQSHAIKQLVRMGLLELLREPRTLFFILIFPLMFLGMFWGISLAVPESEDLGFSMIEYMFPGILILALFSTGVLGTSIPLIELRKKGTIRLLQVTPLPKETFIVSQVIVRFILAIAQIILFLIIGFLMNLVTFSVMVPLFLASLLGMAMVLMLGFIFGSIFNSPEVAGGLLGGLFAPVLMLSGVLFPLHILPGAFETFAKFIPFTYIGDLTRSITLPNFETMHSASLNIVVVVGCTLVLYFIAKFTFKWEAD